MNTGAQPEHDPRSGAWGARLWRALRLVAGGPGLVAALILGQWLAAKLAAIPVVAAVTAAIDGYAPGTRPAAYERMLAVVAELVIAQPSVAAVMVTSVISVAIVSAIVWTLASGGVISRYALARPGARPSLEAVGGQWMRTLPSVIVQTGWHLVLRAVVVVAAVTAVDSLPKSLGWAVIGITLLLATVALDLARVAVVTGVARPYHPATAARAFMVALRTPSLLVPASLLALVGWLATGTTLMAGLWALSDPSWLWVARACTAVGLLSGLTRLAFVLGHPARADLIATPEDSGDSGDA